MLDAMAWRAARLVVDTASTPCAGRASRASSRCSPPACRRRTRASRRTATSRWPGQALTYKVGQREIERLRGRDRRDGTASRFDLRGFHDEVLGPRLAAAGDARPRAARPRSRLRPDPTGRGRAPEREPPRRRVRPLVSRHARPVPPRAIARLVGHRPPDPPDRGRRPHRAVHASGSSTDLPHDHRSGGELEAPRRRSPPLELQKRIATLDSLGLSLVRTFIVTIAGLMILGRSGSTSGRR